MSEEINISEEARECAAKEINEHNSFLDAPHIKSVKMMGHHIQLLLNQRDTKIAALEAALDGILTRYLNLVLSGDCGFWNPEEESEVINARNAINSAKGKK